MPELERRENPADRRKAPRLPTVLRGKVFPGALDCTVADYSESGACLTFEQPPPARSDGERLLVVIWSTGLAFEGEVRWRDGRRLGVRFVGRCDFRGRTPSALHDVRALWLASRPKLRKPYRAPRSPMLG